jgi:hypothetical protein
LLGPFDFGIKVIKEELIPFGSLPVLKKLLTNIKTSELMIFHTFL